MQGALADAHPLLVPLGVVVLLGAALRLHDLGAESYWLDEMKMIEVAGGSIRSIFEDMRATGRPPVYVVLAHYWMALFGASEAATRALSALPGIAAIPLMYLVGRNLFDGRVGLVAALFLAGSGYQIGQAQNFRYYALFVLLVLASMWAYLRASRGQRTSDLALYVALSALMYYTHSSGFFFIVAQLVYLALVLLPRWHHEQESIVRWCAAQLALFAAILPGLTIEIGLAVQGTRDVMGWIDAPRWWIPGVTLARYVLPGHTLPRPLLVAVAVAFATAATALFAARMGTRSWLVGARESVSEVVAVAVRDNQRLLLVACWLICPITIPLILSWLLAPMYTHLYAIAAAPALYLLLAVPLVAVRRSVPLVASLGAVAILVGPGLFRYYQEPTNEQWRETAAFVEDRWQPGDKVIFAPHERGVLRNSFDWYARQDPPGCSISSAHRDASAIKSVTEPCLAGVSRFWVIIRGPDHRVEPYRQFFLDGDRPGLRLLHERQFIEISVYLFERSEPRIGHPTGRNPGRSVHRQPMLPPGERAAPPMQRAAG